MKKKHLNIWNYSLFICSLIIFLINCSSIKSNNSKRIAPDINEILEENNMKSLCLDKEFLSHIDFENAKEIILKQSFGETIIVLYNARFTKLYKFLKETRNLELNEYDKLKLRGVLENQNQDSINQIIDDSKKNKNDFTYSKLYCYLIQAGINPDNQIQSTINNISDEDEKIDDTYNNNKISIDNNKNIIWQYCEEHYDNQVWINMSPEISQKLEQANIYKNKSIITDGKYTWNLKNLTQINNYTNKTRKIRRKESNKLILKKNKIQKKSKEHYLWQEWECLNKDNPKLGGAWINKPYIVFCNLENAYNKNLNQIEIQINNTNKIYDLKNLKESKSQNDIRRIPRYRECNICMDKKVDCLHHLFRCQSPKCNNVICSNCEKSMNEIASSNPDVCPFCKTAFFKQNELYFENS